MSATTEQQALDLIEAHGHLLRPNALAVLRQMHEQDEELVAEGRQCFVGYRKVRRSTVNALLRACAISLDQHCILGKFERYSINGTGRDILERVNR